MPRALIGASAHSASEAAALLRAGADYVTVSPVFVTASKPGYGPALGLEDLARIVAQAPGPVVVLTLDHDSTSMANYQRLVARLRQAGIGTGVGRRFWASQS